MEWLKAIGVCCAFFNIIISIRMKNGYAALGWLSAFCFSVANAL